MNISIATQLYAAWKAFKGENARFLGYGKPHVPSQEERVFHSFEQGYKAGRKDQALSSDILHEEEQE